MLQGGGLTCQTRDNIQKNKRTFCRTGWKGDTPLFCRVRKTEAGKRRMKSNSKVNKNRRRFFIILRNARVTLLLLLAVVALTLTNCSDTTGNMGIPPSNETLTTSSKTCSSTAKCFPQKTSE